MEDFKVLSVLKKFIPDEQYDNLKEELGKFEVELNTDINKYVTANTPDKDSLLIEAKKTAHAEVITELGIKGVETSEQLTQHMADVKLSSTDQAKALTALTTERDTLKADYDAEVTNRTKLETETKLSNEYTLVKALKQSKYDLTDDDAVEFLHTKLSKQVTDELPLADVLKAFEEANPVEEVKQRFGNPRFVQPKVVAGAGTVDYAARYAELKKEGKIQ